MHNRALLWNSARFHTSLNLKSASTIWANFGLESYLTVIVLDVSVGLPVAGLDDGP